MLTPPSNVNLMLTLYFLNINKQAFSDKHLIKIKTDTPHPPILITLSENIHMFVMSTYRKLTFQITKNYFKMKTTKLFKGLALGVMFTLGVSAFAGEGDGKASTISIYPYLDTDFSVLSLNNQSESNAILTIEGKDGEVFHRELISKAGFTQKVLDFSYLSDGDYAVVLKSKGKEYFSKDFAVKNHKIVSNIEKEVAASNANTTFANVVDNTLIVSYIPFGVKNVDVTISSSSEDIFTETFKAEKTFSKKFDISTLPKGDYHVTINSEDKNYTYAFRK